MPIKRATPQIKKPVKRADTRTLRRFVEEFSWLLSGYDDLDFRALANLATEGNLSNKQNSTKNRANETTILLGRLPSLFMDESLFPTNEDIVEFARHALEIDMPRWHKKSKYELIGNVVCNANLLNVKQLKQLITAVENLQESTSDARDFVKKQRKLGLSWNEVIQQMLSSVI